MILSVVLFIILIFIKKKGGGKMFKTLNQENIELSQSQEKPALAWILKLANEAYDLQKMAWENRYADYHDCIFFDG